MRVSVAHSTSRAKAISAIDTFLDGLMGQGFSGGVKVQNPEKSWSGNQMDFSFYAKKGLFGTTINGSVTVTDKNVVLESQLPGMVTTFVSEDEIKETIREKLEELFQ